MKFGIAQYISREISGKGNSIEKVSKELEEFFLNKNYSSNLDELFLGFLCVSDQFKSFFKKRNPKYLKTKKCFEFDIEFSFIEVSKLTYLEIKNLIIKSLVLSVDTIKSFVDDFDDNQFLADLRKLQERK